MNTEITVAAISAAGLVVAGLVTALIQSSRGTKTSADTATETSQLVLSAVEEMQRMLPGVVTAVDRVQETQVSQQAAMDGLSVRMDRAEFAHATCPARLQAIGGAT